MPHSTLFSRTTVALCLAIPALAANAANCSVKSPPQTVALVELFTSEGCSSCPPADRWLGELSHRYTAQQVLPLSLHVDYWDYIGWKDPFAQAQFSERQRWLSRLGANMTIYTPEVFTGMKEIRRWRNADEFESRVQTINRRPARADIAVSMRLSNSGSVDIEARFALLETAVGGQMAQGAVILYEKQLSSEVKAGENGGTALKHDNVVRFWSTPVALDAKTGRATLRQTVALPAGWKRDNLGIAALVQDAMAGEVLQAVSMPVCV